MRSDPLLSWICTHPGLSTPSNATLSSSNTLSSGTAGSGSAAAAAASGASYPTSRSSRSASTPKSGKLLDISPYEIQFSDLQVRFERTQRKKQRERFSCLQMCSEGVAYHATGWESPPEGRG